MRRAFLSLYSLIVVAVIAVGWGLDRVWQSQVPGEIVQAGETQLLDVLGYLLQQTPAEQQREALEKIGRETGLELTLHTAADFASTQLFERMIAGDPVVVDTGDTRLFYRKLKNQDQILALRQPVTDVADPLIYNLLLLSFYLAIALVIFLWIWPLSRDLSKLEKQTKLLGSEVVPDELRIAPTSAVYDLASAFNRMARRVRDLLASHKEMTYAVSHELRTPLARMKFGLEMANDMQDVGRIKQQLAGVREDVTEMDALVNQLFAYAGFENSEQVLDFQPGDMGALIHQLILRVKANPAHAQLHYKFKSELSDDSVICEWYLMERAILNLLHNAQRYAKSAITVTLRQAAGQFQILVDDDGPGIPAGERQRIFQSFIRLTNHTNAQSRGLGLGLAIVSKIMQWHGGRAFAEEAPAGGARLVLEWHAQPPGRRH
jgi:two-component system OmpR family sensor kinase